MNFNEKAKRVAQIEFWVSSVIYLLAIYSLLEESDVLPLTEYPGAPVIIPLGPPFLRELIQYTSIYAGFVFLTMYVVPRLIRKEAIVLNVIWVLATTLLIGVVFGSLDAGIAPLSGFVLYSAFKYGLIVLWHQSDAIRSRFRFLAPGVMFTAILWLISTALFLVGDADLDVIATWVTVIPFGLLLYSYSFFSLIPAAMMNKRPLISYLFRVIAILALASLPIGVVCYAVTDNDESMASIVIINVLLQFFLTTPFTWILYKRHKQGTDEIDSLQRELGQSTANIDFLRSQINPHFLFNAMNTLYGTAIQEKAERTAEAIQKLGDMMRFMLHENMQPRILLAREIEYLKNYISLQRLRTDPHRDVTIHTAIDEAVTAEQIPPMLLIPFVENAFKHGISFREPSHIGISLSLNGDRLHFDVTNSQHPRTNNDPEQGKSGIGLANVKQRLQLLYPGKYVLNIRETGKEFFVHLTIQLG